MRGNNFFEVAYLDKDGAAIGSDHSIINFYHPNDYARKLTWLVGLVNRGPFVFLDNGLVSQTKLVEFVIILAQLEIPLSNLAARVDAETETHTNRNCIKIIEVGIMGTLNDPNRVGEAKEVSQPKPLGWRLERIVNQAGNEPDRCEDGNNGAESSPLCMQQ